MSFVVWCLLCIVCFFLVCVVSYMLSVARCLLSVACFLLLSVVRYVSLFGVWRCLLFMFACCLLHGVCCVLFVVVCWLLCIGYHVLYVFVVCCSFVCC